MIPLLRTLGFRPAGYLYKTVVPRPTWLAAPAVDDIYSISDCCSPDFCDYVAKSFHGGFRKWPLNGFWLFDDPATMRGMAAEEGIALEPMRLFYYEALPQAFDPQEGVWFDCDPDPSFKLEVVPPGRVRLEGFDVASYSSTERHDHSPLSCNHVAEQVVTNSHCLFATFAEARAALDAGGFAGVNAGHFRVFAVCSMD